MLSALTLLFTLPAYATPVQLGSSARLIDAAGTPLNGNQAITGYLCPNATPTGGETCHVEAFGTLNVADGYVSPRFGTAASLDHTFLDQDLWVSWAINGGGELLPRTPVGAVPYAVSVRGGTVNAAQVTSTGSVTVGAGTVGGPCTQAGALLYDTTAQLLLACNGTSYRAVGTTDIVIAGGARQWSDGTDAASCEGYRRPNSGTRVYTGNTGDGLYWIDGAGGAPRRQAWCDMTADGGGWTLGVNIQTDLGAIDLFTYSAASAAPTSNNYGLPLSAMGLTSSTAYRLSCVESSDSSNHKLFIRGLNPAEPIFQAAGTITTAAVECSASDTFSTPATGAACLSYPDDTTHTYYGAAGMNISWALFSPGPAYTLRHCAPLGSGYHNKGAIWYR